MVGNARSGVCRRHQFAQERLAIALELAFADTADRAERGQRLRSFAQHREQGRIVELKPNGRTRVVDAATGRQAPDDALSREFIDDTISYYQVASQAYRRGELKYKQ